MAETEDEKIEISDRKALSRYEIRVDGDLAGLSDYVLGEDEITFTHTETRPEFGGQGLASKLVEFAVTDARNRNLEIIPSCPFVRDWIAENPE